MDIQKHISKLKRMLLDGVNFNIDEDALKDIGKNIGETSDSQSMFTSVIFQIWISYTQSPTTQCTSWTRLATSPPPP